MYTTYTARGIAPSRMVRIDDDWTAYQFDAAVSMLGTAVENALYERVGDGDKRKPRYTLEQLLDPGFRLPSQQTDSDDFFNSTQIKRVHGLKYDEVS